nr:PREDICTED: uncharacterized protein LOC105675632 [Linepithema humile]
MAALYNLEIHEICELLTSLMDRVAVLRGAVHQFEEATRLVQQQHVLHSFRVDYDVHGCENGIVLASMQDIRANLTTAIRLLEILTTRFQQMENNAARTAVVLHAVAEALSADAVQPYDTWNYLRLSKSYRSKSLQIQDFPHPKLSEIYPGNSARENFQDSFQNTSGQPECICIRDYEFFPKRELDEIAMSFCLRYTSYTEFGFVRSNVQWNRYLHKLFSLSPVTTPESTSTDQGKGESEPKAKHGTTCFIVCANQRTISRIIFE